MTWGGFNAYLLPPLRRRQSTAQQAPGFAWLPVKEFLASNRSRGENLGVGKQGTVSVNCIHPSGNTVAENKPWNKASE